MLGLVRMFTMAVWRGLAAVGRRGDGGTVDLDGVGEGRVGGGEENGHGGEGVEPAAMQPAGAPEADGVQAVGLLRWERGPLLGSLGGEEAAHRMGTVRQVRRVDALIGVVEGRVFYFDIEGDERQRLAGAGRLPRDLRPAAVASRLPWARPLYTSAAADAPTPTPH